MSKFEDVIAGKMEVDEVIAGIMEADEIIARKMKGVEGWRGSSKKGTRKILYDFCLFQSQDTNEIFK